MIPAWARRRTPEEQAAFERAEILAEVEELRALSPQELGRRMAALSAAAWEAARFARWCPP